MKLSREQDAERARHLAETTDPKWYVVQRFGRSDKAALSAFDRYKIETYYPTIISLRKLSRRQMSARQRSSGIEVRKPWPSPLFPGYIFMHVDRGDVRLRNVFELGGIGGLVCRDGAPVWMPDDVIAGIRARENGDGCVPGKESIRAGLSDRWMMCG